MRRWRSLAGVVGLGALFGLCAAGCTSGDSSDRTSDTRPSTPEPGSGPTSVPTSGTAAPRPDPVRSGPEIDILPTDDAAAIVRKAPSPARFRFTDGVHRGVSIQPRDGDTFTATGAAVLSGAVVVGGFGREGAAWTAASPVEPAAPSGYCRDTTPACSAPEELFMDGRPLQRVPDRGGVAPGRWALVASSGGRGAAVVLGDDPTGHTVELSTTPVAIGGTARDVTVDGLHLEHYANPAQRGVVQMDPGASGWLVASCSVRDSHGVGVIVSDRSTLRGCSTIGNGQQGIGAGGADVVVADNVVEQNNRAGFDPGWSAGGAKFAQADGLVVARNVVRANDGPGLWCDVDCVDVHYLDNVVEDNTGSGIFHEISYRAEIRGNQVRGNGADAPGWLWGAGIQVAASSDVTVEGNVVEHNRQGIVGIDQERGAGPLGAHELANLTVVDNVVRDSGQTGIAQDHEDDDVYERGHHFERNTYTGSVSWGWEDTELDWDQWQREGFDAKGRYSR